MQVTIRASGCGGTIQAPPSKSDAHRLLLCAGLAPGESVIHRIAPSEDLLATMDCLRALGATVSYDGESAVIRGADPLKMPEGAVLPCRESGSTLRFFLPLALLSGHTAHFTGSSTLLNRPLSVYETICRERRLLFRRSNDRLTVAGPLQGGEFTLRGDVSSQFISGLLFALPLVKESSSLRLLPPVESLPYVRMTLRTMARFGAAAYFEGDTALGVYGGQTYRPGCHTVEGDWSNAAFFLALDGVTVAGLDDESLQGDKVCLAYFDALRRGTPALDLTDCPDLAPVCMALAAAHHGAVFTGTRRLRMKESDRGAAMAEELEKFGAQVTQEENRITVAPLQHAPTERLQGHNDHRIVMALAVLCSRTGGVIEGAEAVRKSLPDFFARLGQTGVEVEQDGMDQ